MMDNYLFIVEGPHDIAALSKYLKLNEYQMIRYDDQVPSFWKDLIPNSFPYKGDLLKRVPVPTFFKSDSKTIAIYSAGGDSEIVSAVNNTLFILKDAGLKALKAVGIFCDADDKPAIDRYERLMSLFEKELEDELKPIIENHLFGKVSQSQDYKFGVYIFPDNANIGVLEDLLLDGAKTSYPEIMNHAQTYLSSIESEKLPYIKSRNMKASNRKKMMIGIIANVLKPGKANQVSIEDNDWISQNSLENSLIQKRFKTFLDELLK